MLSGSTYLFLPLVFLQPNIMRGTPTLLAVVEAISKSETACYRKTTKLPVAGMTILQQARGE